MTVYFIGAGPGDPELLTVKSVRMLQDADSRVAVTAAIVAATVVIVVRDFAMALHPEVSTGGSC